MYVEFCTTFNVIICCNIFGNKVCDAILCAMCLPSVVVGYMLVMQNTNLANFYQTQKEAWLVNFIIKKL